MQSFSSRKIVSNVLIQNAFYLLFFLLIASCSKTNNYQLPAPVYSGEQMFRGIFFMEGEFAKGIDNYKTSIAQMEKLNPEVLSIRHELSNEIIIGLKKIDPLFFQKFESDIKTSNFFKIEEALENAGKMIEIVALNSKKYGKQFSVAKKIVSKIDINSYNLDNSDDINALKKDIQGEVSKDKFYLQNDEQGVVAIAFAVVVAVIVWEVAAAVNAAVLVNFWGMAFVRTKVYAVTKVYPQTIDPNEKTKQDLFIVNISRLANYEK